MNASRIAHNNPAWAVGNMAPNYLHIVGFVDQHSPSLWKLWFHRSFYLLLKTPGS